jgi:alkanesulfonate monooxygenase SsuD/methylene tetrahydromethanopterin reductase-like flavin-dependent oxidoreductase (luciferase family)
VGLGAPLPWDFAAFHEETDDKTRAAMLDEGLQILNGLWQGKPFRFQGEHYQLEEMTFKPTPLQTPRIPVWVAGRWANQPPMRRAARWDGFFPISSDNPITPDDCRTALKYIGEHRTSKQPLELVLDRMLPDDTAQARELLHQYAEAGMTWWIAPIDPWELGAERGNEWQPDYTKKMLDWIDHGPVRI